VLVPNVEPTDVELAALEFLAGQVALDCRYAFSG